MSQTACPNCRRLITISPEIERCPFCTYQFNEFERIKILLEGLTALLTKDTPSTTPTQDEEAPYYDYEPSLAEEMEYWRSSQFGDDEQGRSEYRNWMDSID